MDSNTHAQLCKDCRQTVCSCSAPNFVSSHAPQQHQQQQQQHHHHQQQQHQASEGTSQEHQHLNHTYTVYRRTTRRGVHATCSSTQIGQFSCVKLTQSKPRARPEGFFKQLTELYGKRRKGSGITAQHSTASPQPCVPPDDNTADQLLAVGADEQMLFPCLPYVIMCLLAVHTKNNSSSSSSSSQRQGSE
jgi:hypothetical protein